MLRSIKTARHMLNQNDEALGQGQVMALGRVSVEVLTSSGRNASVEFRIRRESVELWHHEHLAADIDRELLSEWLHDPDEDLVVDEARLHVDWQVDTTGRVALTLPDVAAWTLSPADLDTLYRRVRGTGQ